MKTWVLILFLFDTGGVTVEFPSEQGCQRAIDAVRKEQSKLYIGRIGVAVCVPKE